MFKRFLDFILRNVLRPNDYIVGYDGDTGEEIRILAKNIAQKGDAGESVQMQFSQNAESWHYPGMEDDVYIRIRVGNGQWNVFRFVGKDGNGTPATIKIGEVTTAEAGMPASVTNSGTEQDAIFDFVLPKGADGINAQIRQGIIPPNNILGIVGDWYFNTAKWDVYEKTAIGWTYRGNIKGASGSAWSPTMVSFQITDIEVPFPVDFANIIVFDCSDNMDLNIIMPDDVGVFMEKRTLIVYNDNGHDLNVDIKDPSDYILWKDNISNFVIYPNTAVEVSFLPFDISTGRMVRGVIT